MSWTRHVPCFTHAAVLSHAARLALLRRPPYYELDQAHHLEGRWEGFRSLLERKGGWAAFNRGHEGAWVLSHPVGGWAGFLGGGKRLEEGGWKNCGLG
eukprot:1160425-Pelagomonas_calceolata.AAC.9